MNIFEFIIYQQATYPEVLLLAYPSLMGLLFSVLIGTFIILLLHGWPTQQMIYHKTDAPYYPSRQYAITGTITEEAKAHEKRRKRLDDELSSLAQWIRAHPQESFIIAIITLILLGISVM